MRTIAISDIHGCVNLLDKLLKKVSYEPQQDQLVLVGDYVDRGVRSKQTLDRIIELRNQGAIVLRGNHDDMMMKCFTFEDWENDVHWLNNGAFQTIESYMGFDFFEQGFDWDQYNQAKQFIRENHADHIEFVKSLPFYHETENHIFIHAGINPFYESWKKTPLQDMIWIRDIFHNNAHNQGKTVVFGHTPTANLNKNKSCEIWYDVIHGDKIGIDGAAAYGGQLNALIINENEEGYHYTEYSVNSSD